MEPAAVDGQQGLRLACAEIEHSAACAEDHVGDLKAVVHSDLCAGADTEGGIDTALQILAVAVHAEVLDGDVRFLDVKHIAGAVRSITADHTALGILAEFVEVQRAVFLDLNAVDQRNDKVRIIGDGFHGIDTGLQDLLGLLERLDRRLNGQAVVRVIAVAAEVDDDVVRLDLGKDRRVVLIDLEVISAVDAVDNMYLLHIARLQGISALARSTGDGGCADEFLGQQDGELALQLGQALRHANRDVLGGPIGVVDVNRVLEIGILRRNEGNVVGRKGQRVDRLAVLVRVAGKLHSAEHDGRAVIRGRDAGDVRARRRHGVVHNRAAEQVHFHRIAAHNVDDARNGAAHVIG